MKTIRIWIAVLGPIALYSLVMFAISDQVPSLTYGQVRGRVSYNGRPLEEGALLFVPVDAVDIDWAVGPIGKDGRYSIEPGWRRGRSAKARYRICIIPFPHSSTLGDRSPLPSNEPRPDTNPASRPDETPDSRLEKPRDLRVPEQYTKIWTSPLEVTLDRGSARVDVDLKD